MVTAEKLPFSWRDVEGLPDLARLRLVLEVLPDGEIVAALEAARGRVSCIYPATGEIRAMAFQGFEAGRGACGTIKYRCPAAAFDLDCKGRGACHRVGGVKPGAYGRIVRVDLDKHDRRIFTPTPWVASHGGAATTGAPRWNGSTPGSTAASTSRPTTSAGSPE